jgi:hypothetical protein
MCSRDQQGQGMKDSLKDFIYRYFIKIILNNLCLTNQFSSILFCFNGLSLILSSANSYASQDSVIILMSSPLAFSLPFSFSYHLL